METKEDAYRRESYGRGRERVAALMLLAALALLAVLAFAVPQGTEQPTGTEYLLAANAAHERTPVGGLIEIEDAWAIEDERSEAEAPLVLSMFNGESALGYDAGSDTFYCTLGMENGQDWPELALSVQDAPGVSVVWIDDYAYDACDDAIRKGYSYELLAYTDEEYAYFNVAFTGLPIVSWHSYDADTPIGDEYAPGYASVSAAGCEAVNSAAQIHERGGGYEKMIDKPSYRVEFHELSRKGQDRASDVGVLGMEPDSDWVLLGNAENRTCMSNHLCWQLWSAWNEGRNALCTLDSQMIELFVDDTYMGLYELMPAIRVEEELEHIGANPGTDVVFRVVHAINTEEKRPSWTLDCGHTIELRYKPESMSLDKAEQLITVYSQLNEEDTLADEAFAALAEEIIDIPQVMDYYLFFQACALRIDNVNNNLYIWYVLRNGRYQILLSPWDMDKGLPYTEGFVSDAINTVHVLPRRMLDLDVGGCRAILWSLWEEKKETLLSEESIYTWIRGKEEFINASGAYLREYERWYGEAYELDLTHMYANELEHIGSIEERLRELWPLETQDEE